MQIDTWTCGPQAVHQFFSTVGLKNAEASLSIAEAATLHMRWKLRSLTGMIFLLSFQQQEFFTLISVLARKRPAAQGTQLFSSVSVTQLSNPN